MAKQYPFIGRVESRRKNTQAKCKCGALGTHKVHLEWNIFRGDDLVVWSCKVHKNMPMFLYFDNPPICLREITVTPEQ